MAIKTKVKEHLRTNVNIIFVTVMKNYCLEQYMHVFSAFVGPHYLWALSCLFFFCFKSYRVLHIVINLFVRLEITLQWSSVA